MRKINNKAISIMLIILIYSIFTLVFLKPLGNTYYKIINPAFWILLVILCHFFFKNEYIHKKHKKDVLLTVIISIFIYFILYYLSGLYLGYQQTPYIKTFKGILSNIWNFTFFIILQEYVRQVLINRTGKNKGLVIVITILFIIIDVSKNITLYQFDKAYIVFQYLCISFIPIMAKNMLLSYLTYISNCIPAIIYSFIMETFSFMVPFVPNINWFLTGILNIIFPFIIFVYTYKIVELKDMKHKKKNNKRNIIYIPLLIIVLILAILVSGSFKHQLIAVASNSMNPEFYRGDAVLMKKLEDREIKQLKEGNIIVFAKKNKVVIHRILKIEESEDGNIYYKTKGDNNNGPDSGVIDKKKIIGKYITKIKFIGYPSVILQEILS